MRFLKHHGAILILNYTAAVNVVVVLKSGMFEALPTFLFIAAIDIAYCRARAKGKNMENSNV